MKSTEKLATFLSSAVKGNVPELPKGLVLALRVILATQKGKKSFVAELLLADPVHIDNAMTEVARLALSMRSDDAPDMEIVEFLGGRPEFETEKASAGS